MSTWIDTERLKTVLGNDSVVNFIGAHPDNQNILEKQLLPHANTEVIRITGKQPSAADVDMPIITYAAWIVYFLMAQYQHVSEEEYTRREDNYERAMKLLAEYQGGTVSDSTAAPTPRTQNAYATGDLP